MNDAVAEGFSGEFSVCDCDRYAEHLADISVRRRMVIASDDVRNQFGVATSAAASLAVTNLAPAIKTFPQQDAQVSIGGTFTFSVVAVGSQPITYQWYFISAFGGGPVTVAGGTNASLTVSVPDSMSVPQAEGIYWAEITNPHGSATTESVPSNLDVFP